MAVTSNPADSAARVPAWKRIGLKLKYAQDTPTETQPQQNPPQENTPTIHPQREAFHKPQKREFEYQQPEVPVKRAKVEPAKQVSQPKAKPTPGSAPKTRTAGQQVWNDEERSSLPAPSGVFKAPGQTAKRIVFGEDDEDSSQPLPIAPSPPRTARTNPLRKSVSFTPDTKKEDSFSAQTLIADWEAAESRSEAFANESTEQLASPSKPSRPAKEPKPKKEKKQKKDKTLSTASSEDPKVDQVDKNSNDLPNYVKYLEQFSNDKANWKFNKNRQNDLIKHLFDVDLIPSKYNPALVQYVSTTQGQARKRIAERAEEVLLAIWVRENEDVDPMSLDTPEARRAAYFEALAAQIERYKQSGAGRSQYDDQQLKEILREHEQGKRAEEMLSKALEGEIFQMSTPATTPRSTSVTTTSGPTTKGIPGATRIIETTNPTRGEVITKVIDLTTNTTETKRKRSRKSRTDVSSSSESSSDDSDDESDATPPQKKQQLYAAKAISGDLFDSDVLDKKFGQQTTHNAIAPKRTGAAKGQARGFEYTHGTKADESDSE